MPEEHGRQGPQIRDYFHIIVGASFGGLFLAASEVFASFGYTRAEVVMRLMAGFILITTFLMLALAYRRLAGESMAGTVRRWLGGLL